MGPSGGHPYGSCSYTCIISSSVQWHLKHYPFLFGDGEQISFLLHKLHSKIFVLNVIAFPADCQTRRWSTGCTGTSTLHAVSRNVAARLETVAPSGDMGACMHIVDTVRPWLTVSLGWASVMYPRPKWWLFVFYTRSGEILQQWS
jgi:hypothetical protein